MKLKISKRTVEALEPRDVPFVVFDKTVPAFGVEVRPSGAKTYKLWYRHGSRLRKLTLGRHGTVTADKAREQANRALRAVNDGKDPAQEKIERRAADALEVVFADWLAQHVDTKRKASTRRQYRQIFDHTIRPALGRKALVDISRSDVSRLHAKLAASPYQANRAVAVLRSFFTWTERLGLRPLGSNPARLVERYREAKRERMLSPDELARLGAALAASQGNEWPWALAAIRLLLLTGARKGEILGLRWDQVDLTAGTARLTDSKTGAKTLHFGGPALEILAAVPRVTGNPHVICGRVHGAPLIGLAKVWGRVRKRAGLEDLRIHDLRHAFASAGAMSGLPLLTLGRLLGHSQPSVTDRYAHLASAPLVSAADAVASSIAAQLATPLDRRILSEKGTRGG